MTEEQIKQNAEEYINKMPHLCDALYESVAKEAFIAGAHSRDEEIEMLQNKIEELSEQLKMNAENFQKLCHHPWISVEERLPEPHTPVYAKNNNSKWFFALRTDNRVRPWYNIVERCPTKVTHWMPIQKLKKE